MQLPDGGKKKLFLIIPVFFFLYIMSSDMILDFNLSLCLIMDFYGLYDFFPLKMKWSFWVFFALFDFFFPPECKSRDAGTGRVMIPEGAIIFFAFTHM